jgi:hypothetical protein
MIFPRNHFFTRLIIISTANHISTGRSRPSRLCCGKMYSYSLSPSMASFFSLGLQQLIEPCPPICLPSAAEDTIEEVADELALLRRAWQAGKVMRKSQIKGRPLAQMKKIREHIAWLKTPVFGRIELENRNLAIGFIGSSLWYHPLLTYARM